MADLYSYRVAQGRRVISIDLRLNIALLDSPPKNALLVTSGFWLHVMDSRCTEWEKKRLLHGLFLVADQIQAPFPDEAQALVVTVIRIDYVPSDFQEEALTCAIVKWAERKFGFQGPEIQAAFREETGRYEFEFGFVPSQ